MEPIAEFFRHLGSLDELIRWGGLLVLVIIVFAETGLLIGFFLPGDSLLITAGLFAARGDLPIGWLLVSLTVAGILGQAVGYWIGYKAGPHLFARPDSRLFRREHLLKTQAFYEKHGGKAVVLSRFVPIVRTFVPVISGVAQMPFRRFMLYNILGGIGWVFSMCLIGYILGVRFPAVVQHIEKLIVVVVFLSILPVVWHAYKERASARRSEKLPAEVPVGRES
jgi:membrane-associated protein